ncbi:MAG: M15 family metallopeptidase [Treponema sp.]|nr:M15 family metallopeptidase [Treponema sp.]
MRVHRAGALIVALLLLLGSCVRQDGGRAAAPADGVFAAEENAIIIGNFERERAERDMAFAVRFSAAMRNAELPEDLYVSLLEVSTWNPSFMNDLHIVLAGPRYLRELVDPWHPLPSGYSPPDLVPLVEGSYRVSRAGLMMRLSAAVSLEEMATAARADGITLVASSAYRSYDHQTQVHNRLVQQMGRAAAQRVSARPGHSQHQTGLALDFGTIDNSFAQTPAGLWMTANAYRFGWSLSYPDGYEHITGYSWESWHFRYLGRELAAFKYNYFRGIQQFALRFLHEWERLSP